MALIDDLNRLAAQDIVYLTRVFTAQTGAWGGGAYKSSTEVWRGRLRQALSGSWIFNAFTNQNGVVGFDLGTTAAGSWNSTESPVAGLQVTNSYLVIPAIAGAAALLEAITLTTVIPANFTE